jgi:gas vesicle protein
MRTNSLVCFLIGLASGAAAALLFAPASGEENRRWLADRGLEGAGKLIGEDRVEKGRRAAARGKEAAGFARDSIDVLKRGRRLGRPLEEQ